MESNFDLPHVVLYAKGWYERTDDLYNDLRKMLSLDGYGDYKSENDIFEKMINSYSNYNEWRRNNGLQYKTIYDFINNASHYKSLYPNKEMADKCYILDSILGEYMLTDPNEIIIVLPIYHKGLRDNRKKQGETYKEMNLSAQKIFNKNYNKEETK